MNAGVALVLIVVFTLGYLCGLARREALDDVDARFVAELTRPEDPVPNLRIIPGGRAVGLDIFDWDADPGLGGTAT